jgi:chorismate synthase
MNTFGKNFRLTTFGESHGVALGALIDGCPSGLSLTAADIQAELDRRKPGQSKVTTPRQEADQCEILSGVFEDKTTGAPICAIVRNMDQRSKDYSDMKDIYRPGHADETWAQKWEHRDYRGGGRQSGRETLSRVIGGAIAKKLLQQAAGTEIYAHVTQIADVKAESFDREQIEQNMVRCGDAVAAEQMITAIEEAKKNHESLGAIVEIIIKNPPKNLGQPVFGKVEAMLAQALMSIGTTRSFEYGVGKAAAGNKGSEQNREQEGISGGITTGDDIRLTVGIKPTPTIAQPQVMHTASGEDTEFTVHGRHDPCIAPRFVPVAEAMVALTLADFLLSSPDRIDQIFR